MKLSITEEIKNLRLSFLDREQEEFKTFPNSDFKKIKEWNDESSTVIWEGNIVDESLSKPYKIQIHYGSLYPYKRPTVYPVDSKIINQRHQMPNWKDSRKPGSLCYMPVTPDYWHMGLTCRDVIKRVTLWFYHFEAGTLESEFAPPEIEVYFSSENSLAKPEILAMDTLLLPESKKQGSLILVPTRSERFALVSTLNDSENTDKKTKELIRLKNLILPYEILDVKALTIGTWFKLDTEPELPLPRKTTDLTKLLLKNGISKDQIYKLAKMNSPVIGLCYPTEVDALHWLVFKTKFIYPNREGVRKKNYLLKFNEINRVHPVKLYPLSQINTETIFRRVAGFQVEKLLDKKCLILGVGSLGSTIAEELVKAGIGSLTLIDNDVMKAGNVCRHRLGLNYLGQNKTTSLKSELLRKNPFMEINTLNFNPLTNAEKFSSLIENIDLVISCFGDDSTELFVNLICCRANKPVVYCRSYLQGRLGEIILTDDYSNCACLSCIANHLNSKDCSIPRPPEISYQDLVKFEGGCGTAFIPANSVDLGFISLHCTRIALNYLQNSNLNDCNYWLIRGRDFENVEYSELISEIREPFEIHTYLITKDEKCSVC